MISVSYQKTIGATPEQLFTTLTDHHNLHQFFNAKFDVVKEQNSNEPKGGKGCVRQVSILGVSFLEEIIAATPQEIRYRVINDFADMFDVAIVVGFQDLHKFENEAQGSRLPQ